MTATRGRGNNDAIDVNELRVLGRKPFKILVSVCGAAAHGKKKRRNDALEASDFMIAGDCIELRQAILVQWAGVLNVSKVQCANGFKVHRCSRPDDSHSRFPWPLNSSAGDFKGAIFGRIAAASPVEDETA
jgi:hypothetical protein